MKNKKAPLQERIFEPTRLLQLFDNDLQAAREILEEAITAIQDLVTRLSVELANGERQATAALVHELKGVSANVGAAELSSISGEISAYLRTDASLRAERASADLATAFERFHSEAQAFLGRSAR